MSLDAAHIGKTILLVLLALELAEETYFFAAGIKYVSSTNHMDTFDWQDEFAFWTPLYSSWLFKYLWIPMFILNACWMVYTLVNAFRKLPDGTCLYFDTDLISWRFLLCGLLAKVLLHLPFFVHSENGYLWSQTLCQDIAFLLVLAAFVFALRDFQKDKAILLKNHSTVDAWFLRLIFHNSIALSLAYVFLTSNIFGAMWLRYAMSVPLTTTTLIVGLDLLLGFFMYGIVDLMKLDHHLRYIMAPYAIWVLSQVDVQQRLRIATVKGGNTPEVRVICWLLLVVGLVFALAKMIAMVVAAVKRGSLDGEEEAVVNENAKLNP